MQTKRQIQELLSSAGVSPNRRLGQHFLVDLNLMRLLVDSAQIGPNDVVLEVGCGTGSLTEALAEQAGAVVAVEIDRTLASITKLRLTMPPRSHAERTEGVGGIVKTEGLGDGSMGRENVQVINADVLSGKGVLNPAVVETLADARSRLEGIGPIRPMGPIQEALVEGFLERPGRLLLVSNLPYDVASPVMIHLAKGPVVADAMFVTVQKEVAERMAAEPGGRDYGTLSIFLQATGQVDILRTLKPSVFWPPPGVDSAMVRFVRSDSKCRLIEDIATLSEVVALFMGHRRKMLRACVKSIPSRLGDSNVWLRLFERHCIDPTLRPGDLTPAQYVQLANACRRIA
jgi:16S rRNA (adenine1518-N6/adenine1519-N6)-dimethyltransferase